MIATTNTNTNTEPKIVVPVHPVRLFRDPKNPKEEYFGDLVLIRTLPDGRVGAVKTASPGDFTRGNPMEQAYDYLASQRNEWIRNGHEENFNAEWEIMPITSWRA